MRLRTAILKQVFKVNTVNAMFSDAIHSYAASAAAATSANQTAKRVGQIMIGQSGGTWLAYKAKATGTGTAAWESLPIT